MFIWIINHNRLRFPTSLGPAYLHWIRSHPRIPIHLALLFPTATSYCDGKIYFFLCSKPTQYHPSTAESLTPHRSSAELLRLDHLSVPESSSKPHLHSRLSPTQPHGIYTNIWRKELVLWTQDHIIYSKIEKVQVQTILNNFWHTFNQTATFGFLANGTNEGDNLKKDIILADTRYHNFAKVLNKFFMI